MNETTSTQFRMTLPAMRVMLVAAAILVFSVGITLNMLTEQTDRFFAWTIATPLTAAFLGAAYWSACVLELLAARERLWVRARIAVPTVLLFTVLTLIVTLLHIDKFHMSSPDLITRSGTWFWLFVYAVVPIVMGGLWILQLRAFPPPAWMRLVLVVQGVILIGLGILLLVVPQGMAPLWPWALTPLTARAIGAWLLAIGIAAAQSVWENDLERVRIATITYAIIGILELIALFRFSGNVNWATTGAWLYLLFLPSLVDVGLASWFAARRIPDRSVLAPARTS